MISNLLTLLGVIGLGVAAIILPYLPGAYDPLAVPLSTTVQIGGLALLPLVPLGGIWLACDVLSRSRQTKYLAKPRRSHLLGLLSLAAAAMLIAAAALLAMFAVSLSLGVLTGLLGIYLVDRCRRLVLRAKSTKTKLGIVAPVYMIVVPSALLFVEWTLAGSLRDFSRSRAMAHSHRLVGDLENYHARHGNYPASLAAVWKDYDPSVRGIERFHYARQGDAYALFFEQPSLLCDDVGAREWVVYNSRAEHRMVSHAAWHLHLTPAELDRSQGWFAVRDAGLPHWKSFLFD